MAIDIGTAVAYLNLDSTNFNTGLNAAYSALQEFERNGVNLGNSLTGIGQTMTNVGYEMTQKLTVPIVNFGQSAIQSFRDYESAFAGVKKTINDSDLDKFGVTYDQLSAAIENMATETASSAEEIAAVMEMAGQLGIPLGNAGENITKFTKTMVMLGDSTNLSAEEAALSLAKFMNITGTAAEDSDRLGSAVVDLGNNFATQEDQIVNMSTRLASAGTIAGLTQQEILALATAMSSAGIRAEAGGSAMATTLTQIEKIVEGVTENSAEQIQTLARIAGMSAEEFTRAWKEDPITALTAFLHGLGELEDQGESAVVVLDELDMKGVRQSNMLKALALSAENMDYALQVSNDAWKDNTALVTEAEKRYETLDSKISQLNERWKIMKRDIAELLLPVLERLMDTISKIIDAWNGLTESQQKAIVRFAEIVAAIGPLLVIVGRLLSSIGQIKMGLDILGPLMGNIAAGPIAAIVAGIALLVAGFIKAYNESESFRKTVAELGEQIGRVISFVMEVFMALWQALKPALDVIIQIVSELLQILLPPLVSLIRAVLDVVQAILPIITSLASLLGSILSTVLMAIRPVLEGIALAIGWIIETISAAIEVIAMVVAAVTNVLKIIVDAVTELFDFLKDGLKKIGDYIFEKIKKIVDFMHDVVTTIADFFRWLWDVLFGHSIIPDICNAFLDWFPRTFKQVIEFVKEFVQGFIDKFNELKDKILQKLQEIKDGIIQKFQEIMENIRNKVEEIRTFVVNKIQEIRDNVFQKIEDIKRGLANLVQQIRDDVHNKIEEIRNKINEKVEEIKNNLFQAIEKIKETLRGNWENFKSIGRDLISAFWQGMQEIFTGLWNWVVDKFSGLLNWVRDIWNEVSSLGSSMGGWFNGSHANGLDYVPFDGYVAQLHQGERVLTKQEAKDYDSGKTQSGGDTYNFYNTKDDPYEYARQIKRTKKELAYN